VNNKVTPERWAQIEELFHRAAESEPASRQELLDQACSNDSELRREVEVLLACDGRVAAKMEASVRSELQFMDFPLSGKIVSHYHIIEGLGSGGMGLVYRARDVKLTREVAIKFLPEASAKDADSLRRFEREARSASALEHANICPIYEFGEHEGQPFIVMPRLEGQTVEQLIHTQAAPKGPQQIQKLFDISIQVLKGLEAAHGHGIVHRDIKPGNIFLTSSGEAKILDFGVAKLTEIEEQIDHYVDSEADTVTLAKGTGLTLSRTGAIVGTAAYMSPEQVRGERIDARTDIFSFGLVLYELATGKRVFAGTTWPVLREAVLRGTPRPVRGVNPEVPLKLEDIINKAIEKDREARYQTAAKMRADLEDLQRQLAPKHLPRAWAVGLGVALAVFVATIFILAKRSPKTISVAPEIKLRQLTTNSGENPVTGGSISPDGKYLAYSDTKGLRIKLIDSGETLTVPQPEGLQNQKVTWEGVAWFPDSTKFLVNARPATEFWNEWSSADTSIWVVSVLGGAPTKIREHAVVWSVSPDGSRVSFGTNKGKRGEREIWLIGPNGEQPQKFYGVNDDNAVCCFGWLSDGKRYAYIYTDASGDTMLSRQLKGGPPITLFQSSELEKMNDIVWLPDGRLVYSLSEAGSANYWTMRIDLSTGNRIEPARRLTNWPNFRIYSGSATTNGKRLTFAGASSFYTSYLADIQAGGTRIDNIKHFTLEDSDDVIMDWVGSEAVIVAQNRGDHYSLYKQPLNSDVQSPIVSSVAGGVLSLAVLSPDNKWVIALVWPGQEGTISERPSLPLSIVRIPITGGAPEPLLQVSRPTPFSCARGRSDVCVIAEQTDDHKQMIVSTLDPIKGRGPELARFDLARDIDTFVDNLICVISPDGTRLAIAHSPEGPIEINSLSGQLLHTIPLRTRDKKVGVGWAADRKGFFVTRRAPSGTELLHLDMRGNEKVLRNCFGWGCFAAPSPDGRHLSILDTRPTTNMWMMENF
jgi:eukaryotic-like serine/threonine-protein kinase